MWIDPQTNEVAKTHSDIRALRPNWSGPANMTDEMIADLGFLPVTTVTPQFDANRQEAVEQAPELVDGEWKQSWQITDLPEDEVTSRIAASQNTAWEGIKAERTRRQDGGIEIDGKWFQTDEASRIQYIGLMMLGANIPPDIQWKTMDNTFVPMTQQLVTQIFYAAVAKDQAVFSNAERLRTEMLAADNPSAFNIGDGWPAIYTPAKG